MCILSIKIPIRKTSGNLFNDPRNWASNEPECVFQDTSVLFTEDNSIHNILFLFCGGRDYHSKFNCFFWWGGGSASERKKNWLTNRYFFELDSSIWEIKTFWLSRLMVGYILLCSNTYYPQLHTVSDGLTLSDFAQNTLYLIAYLLWLSNTLWTLWRVIWPCHSQTFA